MFDIALSISALKDISLTTFWPSATNCVVPLSPSSGPTSVITRVGAGSETNPDVVAPLITVVAVWRLGSPAPLLLLLASRFKSYNRLIMQQFEISLFMNGDAIILFETVS